MSLSFVSKTVQTGTSDGGFEERAIESAAGAADDAKTSVQKPLFEQLRHNQEQNDEEREDNQRSIMRATLALDEDDCAHFNALERQKTEKQSRVHQETQDGLAAFRAAQADRMEQLVVVEAKIDERKDTNASAPVVPAMKPPAPKIIIKKRRRKQEGETASDSAQEEKKIKGTTPSTNETPSVQESNNEVSEGGGLGGLMTGYGSSSDDD
jgi:hypothetical protein